MVVIPKKECCCETWGSNASVGITASCLSNTSIKLSLKNSVIFIVWTLSETLLCYDRVKRFQCFGRYCSSILCR